MGGIYFHDWIFSVFWSKYRRFSFRFLSSFLEWVQKNYESWSSLEWNSLFIFCLLFPWSTVSFSAFVENLISTFCLVFVYFFLSSSLWATFRCIFIGFFSFFFQKFCDKRKNFLNSFQYFSKNFLSKKWRKYSPL